MFPERSSAFEIADFAAENGAAGIELMSFCDELREPDMKTAKEIGAYLKKKALVAPCFSTVALLVFEEREKYVNRLKRYAEICSELEIPYLHHTIDSFWQRKDPEADRIRYIEIGAEAVERVNDYAATLGVKTVIEDQGYLFNGVTNFERLRKATKYKIGTLLDTGNIFFADESPVDFARAFSDSICQVHIKDYRYLSDDELDLRHYTSPGGKNFCGCPLGEGAADFTSVAEVLKSVDYNGYYSLELEGAKAPDEFIRAMNFTANIFS
jgi:sugar phosphate isomerase/epimerase